MEENTTKKAGMFEALPPKFAFWAGVVTSAAVFAIVALIIMIVLMLSGADFSSGKTTKTTNTNTNTAVAAANTDTTVSGTVDEANIRNVRGEGDLTIVEFSDYDCPFCTRFHETMLQVADEYAGEVAWAYQHFPLTSLHPNAENAAVAAECANAQDKFVEFTDTYMAAEAAGITSTGNDKIDDVAAEVGLDTDAFDTCRDNDEYLDLVRSDAVAAQALGGRGTPFSVIVDEDGNVVGSINGAQTYANVAAQLDSLLDS